MPNYGKLPINKPLKPPPKPPKPPPKQTTKIVSQRETGGKISQKDELKLKLKEVISEIEKL